MTKVPLLELEGVSVKLGGGRTVVNDVDLQLHEGELVGLIGPNGAGKTTLLRATLGLVTASGQVRLSGQLARSMTAKQRAHGTAYLAQGHEIGWPVSVETLVALGRAPYRSAAASLSEQDLALVVAAMERMDVLQFRQRVATELSGGEQARVLIARALAQDAPALLADEPAAGLDPSHQILLMETFVGLAREGRGVLVSLHDLALAGRWCNRLVVMEKGRIVADGSPAEVLTAERLAQVYGIIARIETGAEGVVVVPQGLV